VRVTLFVIKELITKCFTFVFKEVGGFGLDELAGSRVLFFLREQMRDLRIQVFLRELVGVMAPSDFAGSVLIEILYCSEGGNVEQVA